MLPQQTNYDDTVNKFAHIRRTLQRITNRNGNGS